MFTKAIAGAAAKILAQTQLNSLFDVHNPPIVRTGELCTKDAKNRYLPYARLENALYCANRTEMRTFLSQQIHSRLKSPQRLQELGELWGKATRLVGTSALFDRHHSHVFQQCGQSPHNHRTSKPNTNVVIPRPEVFRINQSTGILHNQSASKFEGAYTGRFVACNSHLEHQRLTIQAHGRRWRRF